MDFFEQSINNYSGLSTETKPTAAGGSNIPNGSRFREIDVATKVIKIYYYNISDDAWYEYDEKKTESDINSADMVGLLNGILKELKIMNIHLSILSDNEIDYTEVE